MRTVSTQLATLALTAAMFALPAAAQTMDHSGTTVAPGAAGAGQSAQSQDMTKAPDQSAKAADSSTMSDSTAMTSDVGGKRASKIIGTSVVNDKDQTIGTVDDILIGHDDKASTAVISVGGFLGIGAKLVSVPFDQLTPAANDRKALTMPNASKESLKAMPAFNYGNGA